MLTILGGVVGFENQPTYSASTIIKCAGQIPNKTACLIEPSSYVIDTYRVDLCQKSPFPDFRSSANYSEAECITIFNGNGNLFRNQLGKDSKYKLPTTGREVVKPGKYKYLTMILKNSFISSGKYRSGETTWRTLGSDEKNLTTKKGDPVKFAAKLRNWRGKDNKDNGYCDNNGGTFSRCEMNYNGYEITAIGLDTDFIESYGDKVTYMFYMLELSTPITLKESSDGYFDLTLKNSLEVYGDGIKVESISTAPFIFEAKYNNNEQ
ncbi:hypothetical protein [Prochlorococcus sp. MIT 1307]|uniref:hypothetical protein n=1 Tax=Prochlorococcus sp. MIT 1307 TaxID=3096219 RepID=UPI002A74B66D|nr:hypothetical protein [Prochlorococcus sp. MIT 1307]